MLGRQTGQKLFFVCFHGRLHFGGILIEGVVFFQATQIDIQSISLLEHDIFLATQSFFAGPYQLPSLEPGEKALKGVIPGKVVFMQSGIIPPLLQKYRIGTLDHVLVNKVEILTDVQFRVEACRANQVPTHHHAADQIDGGRGTEHGIDRLVVG